MQAVIFDMDGTLVDSVDLHARAWQEAFAHFGHQVPFDRIRSQIGKGGDQLMPMFLSEADVAARGAELETFRGGLFKSRYFAQVRAFPQVRPLFERLLHDGWKIALASSAKGDELQTYKTICGITDLLEAETSSDDAEKSKPHPDIFLAAVERLQLPPAECVVVGDSPFDAQAATKAGIRSIGFLSGGFPRADLTAAGFTTLYAGAADVLANYESTLFHRESPRRGHSGAGLELRDRR
jgi:beta-phosphoglucomutase-like phosphatase (HAD superfamily)